LWQVEWGIFVKQEAKEKPYFATKVGKKLQQGLIEEPTEPYSMICGVRY